MKRALILTLLVMTGVVGLSANADAIVLKEPGNLNIDSILSAEPLLDEQSYRREVVIHDSLSTVEVVQVRDGLETVSHKHHHLTVWVLRGATRVTLGYDKSKVPAGTLVNIPPGTSYAFHNMGNTPVVLVCVYTPKFSGKDRHFEN
ncbi:MAG: cupin domain-containing protein [candidate division Zixibacteria bacterium]|nr:cupin domain-containing protein [candidate division Zixibacteria bacterium]